MSNRGPGQLEIAINDRSIGAFHQFVREVSVVMDRSASTVGTLVFDTFRDEQGRWSIQDAGLLKPWDRIRITALFGPATRGEEVMRGFIRDIQVEYPQDMGATKVMVSVQDELLRLDREHRQETLSGEGNERSDGEIVRDLADGKIRDIHAEPGLTARGLHLDGTAVRFMRERAEANGFELYAREGTLYFGPAQLAVSPQPPILVYAGPQTNCLSFDLHHDGHRPDRVRMTRQSEDAGANRGSGKPELTRIELEPDQHLLGDHALSSDGAGLEDFVWSMDATGGNETEAEARAKAKVNENQFKIAAEGELDGTAYGHVLLTHLPVEVDGIGEKYGGRFYVDAVTHQFSATAYTQKFKLIRNATNLP